MRIFIAVIISILVILSVYFKSEAKQIIVGPTGRLQYISTETASGSSSGSYPDWTVDGTFIGVNAKGDNPLYFKSLEIINDVYVLNSYTESE